MTDIDLISAVEAAARASWEDARQRTLRSTGFDRGPWDEAHLGIQTELRDGCRPGVEAAAPLIAAAVLEHAADKIGPYPLSDPAVTDPATGELRRDSSMAIMLAPDGEDASTVRGYLRALAEEAGR